MTNLELAREIYADALDYEFVALDSVLTDDSDEIDAPSDWDAGTVNFDPYI